MPSADSVPSFLVVALLLLAAVVTLDWIDSAPVMDEDDDIDYP